jgi:hypothetical protein
MNRKERRTGKEPSPLGGYSAQALSLIPEYVIPGAPCDACAKPVTGSRTITYVAEDGTYMSVLVRTCALHTDCPIGELAPKLPGLPSMDGVGYMQLGSAR